VLAAVVLALAAGGFARLLIRDRRSLAAVLAIAGPYLAFHLLFQDTSFVRYALPIVPVVAYLAVQGAALAASRAVPVAAAALSIAGVAVASPVLVAYRSEPAPTVRALDAMKLEVLHGNRPAALAMHQTFVRPLEAEDVGIMPQLPSPPRQEWLELVKFWKSEPAGVVWFLADPMRSDLALIDPASLRDATDFRWPLVARPAFGGMRPSAARWYRMPPPGWFAETGWSLTPETAGMSGLRGELPHLKPVVAQVRRREGPARMLIGGRNLAAPTDPPARFTASIDGTPVADWQAAPGFFLHEFEIPAGRLAGEGRWAALSVQSSPGNIPTAIEQFDLQDFQDTMWGYDAGWQEAEFNTTLGVWRWTSDRATLRIAGPPRAVQITLTFESPSRYFDEAPVVRARAGDRELAMATLADMREWSFEVPADALAASAGAVTIETDRTFVPANRDGVLDQRRLGLRVFAVRVLIR
jgi:hypothetical protein